MQVCVMQATLCVLFFYSRPTLPLRPRTVAAVLYYLCESRVPEMVADAGGLGTRAGDRRVEEMGVRYGLGLGERTDGVVRVGVDAEGFVCEDR